ncbi:MAG: DUF262 domain-containing protein [Synergistaceae bacterium]|nr:DUF262 domain-containing protein [Synergistaceae bacterium]
MMDQIFSTTNFTVNQLVEKIETGDLGLPELQRPFVWKDTQIRDLLDSMLLGYPVGYLMLWDCPMLEKKKSIGINEKNYSAPREVIIDGQQRLTSLYAVMKSKRVVDAKYKEREIIISFNPLINKFEVGNASSRQSSEWIYNISELFAKTSSAKFIFQFTDTLAESRKKNSKILTDSERETISENIEAVFNLKKYSFPVFKIKANADEEAVSQIFVRINSQGVKLTEDSFVLTLMSVHWEEGRRDIEKLCADSLAPSTSGTTSYNSIGIKIEPKDVIRTLIAYAFGKSRISYGYRLLRGTDFEHNGVISRELMQKNFTVLQERLPEVMNINNLHEFFRAMMDAGYLVDSMIGVKSIIFYTYAMYLTAKYKFNASNNENRKLTALWFFHAILMSSYWRNESTAETLFNAIKSFSTFQEYKDYILSIISQKFTNYYFNTTLTGADCLGASGYGNNSWYAYVASLNILGTKALFSHSKLPASALFLPGSDGTRKALEKHHLFPKAYLKAQGLTDTQINHMANYAYIDWNDNLKIFDEPPSVYYPLICEGMTEEEIALMEDENALPHGWENMNYDKFLMLRRKLMAEIIRKACEDLKDRLKV